MRTGGGCRTVDREISRFPRKERLHMPGSLTTPGRPALAMTRSDVLPSTICTVSAPRIRLFRGSMAGLCAPLSTLRQYPHGYLRMTRGRCGSLLLHRDGLAPSTPCRSPGALRFTPMNGHRQTASAGPKSAKLGNEIILRHAISSVQTLKLTSVFGPNVWVIGTSEASRPCAIRTRPILGALLRGSKVRQCPPI